VARTLLDKARAVIQSRKQKKLEKIMGLFAKKPSITNDEVEKLLHVSDATATRYLSHLEQQGRIMQTGKTGHAVSYTKR
jgi:Fic family protein